VLEERDGKSRQPSEDVARGYESNERGRERRRDVRVQSLLDRNRLMFDLMKDQLNDRQTSSHQHVTECAIERHVDTNSYDPSSYDTAAQHLTTDSDTASKTGGRDSTGGGSTKGGTQHHYYHEHPSLSADELHRHWSASRAGDASRDVSYLQYATEDTSANTGHTAVSSEHPETGYSWSTALSSQAQPHSSYQRVVPAATAADDADYFNPPQVSSDSTDVRWLDSWTSSSADTDLRNNYRRYY